MVMHDLAYPAICFTIVMVAAPFLGNYMARVYSGRKTVLSFVVLPLEHLIYRICRVNRNEEMSCRQYCAAFLWFNAVGLLVLFLLQLLQGRLPLNPNHFSGVRWDTALNTAISFVTNTNWQAYGGESTMSYLTQMSGLTVQNFVSAAVGMAVLLPLIRSFTSRLRKSIGNFWVDMTRSVLYILLPLCLIFALFLLSQGVVQTFEPSQRVRTLEGAEQTIAVGPAASQIAVKQLGSNGGGFFNANSAHPFENPTPLTGLAELIAILLIPAALPFTFGAMVENRRQGWALFAAMAVLFLVGFVIVQYTEWNGNPLLRAMGVSQGTNMEGKEVRFGVGPSLLWGQATSVTSNGSVNAMHDSMMPLTGLVYMFNMAVGEVIFGGVGVGLIGMLMYTIVAMFLAGLMIGRTPEFLGKKLEAREMIMAVVVVLAPAVSSLIFAAMAVLLPTGLASLSNSGPHGLSEILYAFFSAAGNNGSAFAGLNANTPFYNLTTGFVMLVGRFLTILPALAIAGSLTEKKIIPSTSATFPTASPLFAGLLAGVILIVSALTFFPALVLGPFLEHLLMGAGRTF